MTDGSSRSGHMRSCNYTLKPHIRKEFAAEQGTSNAKMSHASYGDVMKTPVLLVLYLVWLSEARTHAYLDPGSGSMLVQLLLGGVAGAAVIVKLGWQRFRDMFRSSSAGKTESNE